MCNKSMNGKFFFALATALLSVLLLASCADMFQDRVPMPNSSGTLDALFKNSGSKINKLDPPEPLYVESYSSSSEIRMTWEPVKGAAYYMVERAVVVDGEEPPDESEYEPLNRFVYGRSYADEIARNPAVDSPEFANRYYYRVSAFNTAMKYEESEPTLPQSAMLFRPPTNVKATGGESVEYVKLTWEHTLGAARYEIYRSDFVNGASATLIAEVFSNQNWYTNYVSIAEQGKDFYYMIMARNARGNKTPQTRPAYGYARVYGAPNKPANVRRVAGTSRGNSTTEIKIEWDASSEPDAYYAVYRYSNIDSSLTRLAEKTTSTSFTDTQAVRPGVYYYYRVQAIIDDIASGKTLKSEFSADDVNAKQAMESFLLSCPDEVIAEKNSNGTVTIKWRPAMGSPGEQAAYSYNVYTGNAKDGDLTLTFASSVSSGVDGAGYISATGLPIGANAFFRVTTVNSGGLKSAQSMVVSPSPAAAIIADASQYAFIQSENANANGVYPVKITWKKPEGDEHPAFYNIQRSTRTGSGFSKINEESLPANGPWTSVYTYDSATGIYTYIDRNESARVARKYYYRVLSLNELEQGSFPSGERQGWGALTHTQYLLEYNKSMGAALKKLTLMHKPGSTDKLGTETKYGSISGSIYYNAAISGLGARIIISLTGFQEFYIENDPANGVYFTLTGNSNTSASMDQSGTMDGTVTCTGMYPGSINYDGIQIKGGAAGGGTYGVKPDGFSEVRVSWTVLN